MAKYSINLSSQVDFNEEDKVVAHVKVKDTDGVSIEVSSGACDSCDDAMLQLGSKLASELAKACSDSRAKSLRTKANSIYDKIDELEAEVAAIEKEIGDIDNTDIGKAAYPLLKDFYHTTKTHTCDCDSCKNQKKDDKHELKDKADSDLYLDDIFGDIEELLNFLN